MKKLVALGLVVVAAIVAIVLLLNPGEETPTVDPAQETLQDAYDTLNGLISDPSNITNNFSVPTLLVGGVEAVWSSENPGVLTVGQPANNLAVVTVNRPAFGEPDAKVDLSATLSMTSELDATQELTLVWTKELTIKASEVEEVSIENIADVQAIKDSAYDGAYQVTLNNVTVFAKGSDAAFIYDGSGILELYGGDVSSLEVGKVYTVSGTTEWYFGLWELTSWTAVLNASETAQMPTQQVITDVEAYVNGLLETDQNDFAYGAPEDGAFEPVYAKVTGRVYVIPGDTSNYNTYLMPTDYDVTQAWVPGTDAEPTIGLMLYYNTFDMNAVKAYDGKVVTLDLVIYTFRSNNKAFAFYYTGGPEGVLATLTDAEKIEVDSNALEVPLNVLESTTLVLPQAGTNGTTIEWTSSDEAVINPLTGEVEAPENDQVTITLTATISAGSATPLVKTYVVKVGVSQLISIEDALLVASGEVVTVQGYITTNIDNANFLIQDGTGALDIYVGSSASDVKTALLTALAEGTVVEVVAKRGAYNGLEQLSNVESVVVITEPTFGYPIAVDITENAQLENYIAQIVRIRGLELTETSFDSYGNLILKATNGTETFDIRWDSRTATPSGLPTELVVGDVFNVIAGLSWSNGARLRIDSADDITLPAQTIAAALEEVKDTVVTIQGYLTTNVDGNNFLIEDETGAIDIFAGGGASATKDQLLRALNGRYAVEVTAKRGDYNGLEQVSSIVSVTILDNPGFNFPMPTVVEDVSDLSAYIAQAIRIEGAEYVSQATDSYDNVDFTFVKNEVEFVVRWDSRTSEPAGFPLTLVAGDIVDLVVGVYWSNGARLRIDQEGDITFPPITIGAALELANDSIVTIRGYVTANIDNANFLFQDATGALDIYVGSSSSAEKTALLAALKGGYAVEIQASRGAYNGLDQVSNVQFVNVISVPGFDFPTPVDVTSMALADLENYKAQVVELKGLEVTSVSTDNYNNLIIKALWGTDEIEIRWDSRTATPSGIATELVVGDMINVVAGLSWSNGYRLRVDQQIDITLVTE
jgi:uncharacterized protein YdeI (BOF family)